MRALLLMNEKVDAFMNYMSTRGQTTSLSFSDTVISGLARDGGLYMPETFPNVSAQFDAWRKLSYQDLAYEIMKHYADDIPAEDLKHIIAKSYQVFDSVDVTPSCAVGDVRILELWHGPTLAFKDVALQFLGNLFDYLLSKNNTRLAVVAATSGDTGSAAIQGVRGKSSIDIFVMYPNGRVSPMQALQMTTVADANVHNFAVEGSFDDAQNIVKALFNDLDFRDQYHLGAMNSINWARILAQVVYYFYAAFRAQEAGAKSLRFSVPTGNFGDIFAGYVAAQMGLPIYKLILATNENDILTRYFATGVYESGAAQPTTSPSMDIQVASNFERYLYCRSGRNGKQVAAWMATFDRTHHLVPDGLEGRPDSDPLFRAERIGVEQVRTTIHRYDSLYGYTLDPHTAIGVAAAEHLGSSTEHPVICLATAHPAKFPDTVAEATGGEEPTHPILEMLKGLPTYVKVIPAQVDVLKAIVRETLA